MDSSNDTTKSGIYIIRNLINDKFYIGQAQDLHRRWKEHRNALRGNYHVNRHLQSAWNKYGENAFKFIVLEYCDIEQLDECEQVYLDNHAQKDNCYNIAIDAKAPTRGLKYSEESRRKISESRRNISDETRRKISEANRGRKVSNETRRKMSETASNRSEETRRKMGDAGRGRIVSDETRRKHSEASRGKTHSIEVREKMSETSRGENNNAAKLTNTDILEIRCLSSEGWTQTALGIRFRVSRRTIGDIINGKTWKDIK